MAIVAGASDSALAQRTDPPGYLYYLYSSQFGSEAAHGVKKGQPEPVQAPTVAYAPTTYAPPTSYATSGACGGITPYTGGGSCWAIPYDIVACESGGSYTAYNPSGASGAYQLMVGGGGSPAEQDAAASALWAGGAGRSNWVC